MASFDLLVVVGGKPTREPSSAQTLDLTAVRIGASNLAITESSGKLDFAAVVLSNIGTATANGHAVEYAQYTTALGLKVNTSAVGAANGVASLDSGGKVPLSQLPASLMEYQGTWNATTNSPTLADGTGVSGYFYRVQTAGTQDLGSGSQTFVVGDWVMYNGSIWQLSHSGADAVLSVNGLAGAVTLTTTDISEGTNLYYTAARFNTAFSGKSTTDLAEGTNLYHTTARAKAAAVANSITSGITDVAPSQDAVFQALALKADAATTPSLVDATLANNQGSAITVRQFVYLSAAGQVQLAVATNTALAPWSKLLAVKDASIANAATGNLYKPGSVIPGFTGLTVGSPVYLSHGTAGGFALDLTAMVAGDAVISLGNVLSATSLEFNPVYLYTY